MSKIVEANEKIAEVVVDGYKKIETGVVEGYKKIEDGVVGAYKKMEDGFVEKHLVREGETLEEAFVYTYSAQKSKEIEKIRSKYLPEEESKLEKLIRLDKQTEKKGQAVSIALGVIGSLLLGVGMCCTMVWNVGIVMMVIGIIVGICGMGIMGLAYPTYKKLTAKERAKIAEQMIALSNELL